MNPISIANTMPSAPPLNYSYPPAYPPPQPGKKYPIPSAPQLDNYFGQGIFRSQNPDYRVGDRLNIPGYIRNKKTGKGCCIIC